MLKKPSLNLLATAFAELTLSFSMHGGKRGEGRRAPQEPGLHQFWMQSEARRANVPVRHRCLQKICCPQRHGGARAGHETEDLLVEQTPGVAPSLMQVEAEVVWWEHQLRLAL